MAAEGPKEKYRMPDPESEINRQKAIASKFLPAAYYDHRKLYIEEDVFKMMEEYRKVLFKIAMVKEIDWVENEIPQTNNIESFSEVTC